MDTSYRRAEQSFLRDSYSVDALIRYWSARLRSGLTISLEQIPPEASCNAQIEQLIAQHNKDVTIFGRFLSSFEQQVFNTIQNEIRGIDELEQAHAADSAALLYLGWLPKLFDVSNAFNDFVAEQKTANGVYALVGYTLSPGLSRIAGYYLSAYFLKSSDELPARLVLDIESIVNDGRAELKKLFQSSCAAKSFTQSRLARRRYKPISALDTINELHFKLGSENVYVPLIDVMHSPFNKAQTPPENRRNPDEKLRRTLRNVEATPQQCALALKRHGVSFLEIANWLMSHKGFSSLGAAYQVLVDLELISLHSARQDVADMALANYEYPEHLEVLHVDGWELYHPSYHWECTVYIEEPGTEGDSVATSFIVEFEADHSCTIEDIRTELP